MASSRYCRLLLPGKKEFVVICILRAKELSLLPSARDCGVISVATTVIHICARLSARCAYHDFQHLASFHAAFKASGYFAATDQTISPSSHYILSRIEIIDSGNFSSECYLTPISLMRSVVLTYHTCLSEWPLQSIVRQGGF